jgi:hypothetical protein
MKKLKSKIIQIQTIAERNNYGEEEVLLALCEDGSLWRFWDYRKWESIYDPFESEE